jgi:hypothetical protein
MLRQYLRTAIQQVSVSIDTISNKTPPVSLFQVFLNDTGFLINGDGQRLVWIPAHLRGEKIAVHTSTRTVVIGGSNGDVTIIRFLCDSL